MKEFNKKKTLNGSLILFRVGIKDSFRKRKEQKTR